MSLTNNHSTQLWISDHQSLHDEMITYLQQRLCKHNTCGQCIPCTQIKTKEHPWIIWLNPERSYSLEQIDEVIAQAGFQLDFDELRFFIFTQAERLTEQCSNRLLKTIEEPYAGYHFFFLTNRAQALPITVQSRCIIQKFKAQSQLETHQEFLKPFLTLRFQDPINFIKQLESLDIKEQETKELTDELFDYWTQQIKKDTQDTTLATVMSTLFQQAIIHQPMSGGSKIFWKNLYIAAHHATKNKK